jgi:eukaryotic-like serine/threonine-protein kinase
MQKGLFRCMIFGVLPGEVVMKRIGIFALILTACFASRSSSQQAPSPSCDSWSEFHRTNMQRSNPCETVLNIDNVGTLELKWSYMVGEQSFRNNSPAVVDGVVYVGSGSDNVYALNAATGALIWSHNIGAATAAPAVANGVVYVGTSAVTEGAEGTFYALNAATGDQLWSYPLGEETGALPASVVDDVVYFGTTNSDEKGFVYALNATTGALLWSYGLDGAADNSPAVLDGVVYAGASISALNASTGSLLWENSEVGTYTSSLALADGVVLVGSGDGRRVYGLDAATGTELWSTVQFAYTYSSPAVAKDIAYFGSDDEGVRAVYAKTGGPVWAYAGPRPSTSFGSTSSPAVGNGVLYCGGGNDVFALNAATGAQLWTYTATGEISSPAVAGGMVYVGSYNGYLYAFGLPDGKK